MHHLIKNIVYQPIGIIHSPFKEVAGMPIQPCGAKKAGGSIELLTEYEKGLKDIKGFSHIIILYHFHKITHWVPEVIPFMDNKLHGIFATRSPARPNAIGISILPLLRREGGLLYVEELDILDQTPVLDLKPFFGPYDNRLQVRSGWLDAVVKTPENVMADDRFT